LAASVPTYLFCFDETRTIGEDVKKRFADATRYNVTVFSSRNDFIDNILKLRESRLCKVAIINIPDSPEKAALAYDMVAEIKEVNPADGLIIVLKPDSSENIPRTLRMIPDATVPRNSNTILRIHNAVKKIISEHNIIIYRRKRNISLYILLGFIVFALFSFLFARLQYPLWF
jgi:hypothetical protein